AARPPGFLLFFFSGRRRHTRWPRDWSSDVCSSDLKGQNLADPLTVLADELKNFQEIAKQIKPGPGEIPRLDGIDVFGDTMPLNEIGRASCRERVQISAVDGELQKKVVAWSQSAKDR